MKKKRKYCQLNQYHRKKIDELLLYDYSLSKIALKLGFDKSTISREIKRNSHNGKYYPVKAHKKTKERQSKAYKNKIITRSIEEKIKELIEKDWSPEQITNWCRKENVKMLSHEMIYQFIYKDERNGGELYTHLRHFGKRRKKYGGERLSTIKNKRNISDRPKVVEDKSRIGDWEIDTVIGAKHEGALVTIVDRKSKYLLSKQVNQKTADNVKMATIELLKPIADDVHTITSDNGLEFAHHEKIAKELECEFYFADPYSSWQRGLNENTNGLLRQYFPKGSSLKDIDNKDVVKAMNKINERPRKGLNYNTPKDIFIGVL